MTNAALTTITVPGSVDAYGDPASNTSAWTGSVKGYLKRPRTMCGILLLKTSAGNNLGNGVAL